MLCTDSNINLAYGYTQLSFSALSCDAPEPQSHGTYSTDNIHYLQQSLQLERCGFCVQECSLPIKSALSFTVFREISSTAALMKLLLPIEIHVAVWDFQATHRPTITGLLVQNCVIQISLLRGVWNSGAAPAGVHRGAAIGF